MSKHFRAEPGKGGLSVKSSADGFDKAFRVFKKKVMQDGLLREVRDRQAYIKPSERARKARAESLKRIKRAQAKREAE